MYFTGYEVQQDYAEAVKWYREAAEQGFIEAQFNLARGKNWSWCEAGLCAVA